MKLAFAFFLVGAVALTGSPVPAAAQPPAVNNWQCRPTPAHPRPVVLLHGITDSVRAWDTLAPRLTDAGYCVFALDYGKDERTRFQVNGFAPIRQSMSEVGAFLDVVAERTGTDRVDLVAHSEGAAIALLLAKEPDYRYRIGAEVLLAPPTFGTTLFGLVELADHADIRPVTDEMLSDAFCPACTDLEAGSPLITELSRAPIAVRGIRYHVLATRDDTIITPVPTASFIPEPGVQNVLVQDLAPGHVADHAVLPRDPIVMAWVMTALGQ